MVRSTGSRPQEWLGYYEKFDYFSPDKVRDGCHPRIAEHAGGADNAIVLVHGLTDSPHYMSAIADYFFNELRYNIYLPLLHCHGLREPRGMEGVQLGEWQKNVTFAVECAAAKGARVSIGGLSTGGALSFQSAVNDTSVNGNLYLFSAALDIAGGVAGLVGEIKERLLRFRFVDVFDKDEPLIGANPVRYARMDVDGAKELAQLIKQTDGLMNRFSGTHPFPKRVFAAHSESDTSASISGVTRLQKRSNPDRFTFFRIPKDRGVPHASVVLKDPVYASNASPGDEPLEIANPLFDTMMEQVSAVARKEANRH